MTEPRDGTTAVAALLEATLGLSFAGPRRGRLLAAIEAQRRAAGVSAGPYLAAASRPGRVFDRLVAEVTVGETFFFRDRAQIGLLRDVVLPELAAGPPRPLALWSAGCAGGEEAFTLAALAEEAGLAQRCRVVGTDASRRAIDKAEQASYGAWSMRATTPAERASCFQEHGSQFRVADRLRERTRFVQRNLLDGPPPPGRFDVVLCRNLLIYLTPEAVRRAAEVLTEALTPHGWLLTAAGDPPLAAPGLRAVRTPQGLAYRRERAAAGTRAARAVRAVPAATRASTVSPPRRRSRPDPAAPPTAQGTPTALRPPPPAGPAAQVRALGDAGRLAEACRLATAAVQACPLDVELQYLAGVVLLEAGRLDEAATAASSAVYLGPELPVTHLLLGQVEDARGNRQRARRSFRNGSRLLAAAPAEEPVALTDGVPAGHLSRLAAHYLAGAGR